MFQTVFTTTRITYFYIRLFVRRNSLKRRKCVSGPIACNGMRSVSFDLTRTLSLSSHPNARAIETVVHITSQLCALEPKTLFVFMLNILFLPYCVCIRMLKDGFIAFMCGQNIIFSRLRKCVQNVECWTRTLNRMRKLEPNAIIVYACICVCIVRIDRGKIILRLCQLFDCLDVSKRGSGPIICNRMCCDTFVYLLTFFVSSHLNNRAIDTRVCIQNSFFAFDICACEEQKIMSKHDF